MGGGGGGSTSAFYSVKLCDTFLSKIALFCDKAWYKLPTFKCDMSRIFENRDMALFLSIGSLIHSIEQ